MSPISSRNKVPLFAASNFPVLSLWAEVKEPLRCPKSSLSISSDGIAAQFTSTKGPSFLKLFKWIWRATNSLPAPFGPRISTLAFVGDIFTIRSFNSTIFLDIPTISN